MKDLFIGSASLSYAISAGNASGHFYDFSTSGFVESPTIKHVLIDNYSNLSNVYEIDNANILASTAEDVFIFVHSSGGGSLTQNPVALFEYFEIGIAISDRAFAPTIRSDDADNPTPKSNRRASFALGSIVFNK